MTQTKEQKEELEKAKAAAPSKEEQANMASRVPPLARTEETSFVPVEDTDATDVKPEDVQPNLTDTSLAALEASTADAELTIQREDRAKSTYKRSAALTEVDIERMTDAQLKDANVLKKAVPRYHPARLAPSSERERSPLQRSPAAGPGTWPVPEDQLPAAMPSDPPLDERPDGDKTFSGVTGFTQTDKGLSYRAKAGTVLNIPKKEVAGAAALYLRLRQQFPHFTTEQLNDEFAIQYETRIGGPQSHRPGDEISPHGLTAVGDDRVPQPLVGPLRKDAPEADPAASTPASPPAAGLPSTNEPASRAPDMAKEPTGETDKADAEAKAEFAKFDKDGDGRPGGAPPGGNKKKSS